MKRVRYTKYEGGLAGEIEHGRPAQCALRLPARFRLSESMDWSFSDLDHTMDDLRDALKRALESVNYSISKCRIKSTRCLPMASWTN